MILKEEEIDRKLFCGFIRHQVVDQCLRRENNKWVVRSDPFVDDWTEEDYQTLIGCLRNTAHTDGFVYGAFLNDVLKGFVSVERGFFCGENLYMIYLLFMFLRICGKRNWKRTVSCSCRMGKKTRGKKTISLISFRCGKSGILSFNGLCGCR